MNHKNVIYFNLTKRFYDASTSTMSNIAWKFDFPTYIKVEEKALSKRAVQENPFDKNPWKFSLRYRVNNN